VIQRSAEKDRVLIHRIGMNFLTHFVRWRLDDETVNIEAACQSNHSIINREINPWSSPATSAIVQTRDEADDRRGRNGQTLMLARLKKKTMSIVCSAFAGGVPYFFCCPSAYDMIAGVAIRVRDQGGRCPNRLEDAPP
jgi:hypothetical protein